MTLIDTSILIDILRGKRDQIGDSLSIISEIEVIRVLDKSELPRPEGRSFLLHSPTLPVAFRYG
ncbi:hypothetical protein [Sulfurisphaera ohwakuensis]|uniref:Putative nucleic acid-binding protein n=1 Tax=Sulfurisphaera ohwakuensis TaxID=69656 RepID=A0A7J9RXJ7_SULOH|nr:hypothetical protein [Sulfurisphaera ohwakuensis]MBB5253944.1 putative nucleic acid-binding protein [Sulfurisphaera ohwakuensis]